MKFNFSFQKVLDVKEKQKEIAHQEFGTIKLRQIELEEQIEGLELEKEKVFDQYNNVHKKTVSDILAVQQEIEHVNLQMKQMVQQSQKVHLEVEKKHQVLIEKTQDVKMWDQWKAKSKDAFKKQLDQKEQAMMDEMAVLRYARRI